MTRIVADFHVRDRRSEFVAILPDLLQIFLLRFRIRGSVSPPICHVSESDVAFTNLLSYLLRRF